METKRYLSYSDYLLRRYGYRIYRVGVDGGFSCPNRNPADRRGGCIYCDSQGASSAYIRVKESMFNKKSAFEEKIDDFVGDNKALSCSCEGALADRIRSVRAQIERGLEFLKRRYKAEHFALYFQAFSGTYARTDELETMYEASLEGHAWDALIISTRPDCIDEEKLSLLKRFKAFVPDVILELGLQTADDEILRFIRRGHDAECFEKAARLVKRFGFELCTHIILGLPGEDRESVDKTIALLNCVHTDALKIHNLNITAGTPLYDMFKEGSVRAPNAEEHIEKVIYVLRRIPSDIVIERLICETPPHRLASPRNFPDKNTFLKMLNDEMERRNAYQGDLYEG